MNILDTECLKLNANWTPIAIVSVRKSLEDCAAGAATLLRFDNGYPIPYRLEDWLNIPVSDNEEYIGISGKFHGEIRKIAIPRVMISINFNQIIAKEQKPHIDNLLKHYDHKDAVTGKPLTRERASREHFRPKSKGGDSSWKNLVPMDKTLNSRRGNKSYRKLGLKKPKILPPPKSLLPINSLVNKHGYSEWKLFGIRDA